MPFNELPIHSKINNKKLLSKRSSRIVVRMKLCIKQQAIIIRGMESSGWYETSRKMAHLALINPKHLSIQFLAEECRIL